MAAKKKARASAPKKSMTRRASPARAPVAPTPLVARPIASFDYCRSLIRDVPDFPKPGIVFKDITPLLASPKALHIVLDGIAERFIGEHIDAIVGIEARGFIFGGALAARLNASFVPVRKPGKLPGPKVRVTYDLEYGSDTLEIHADAIEPGQRVVLVDDLLATGGTMEATIKLVQQLGGTIAGLGFAIELDFLKGRDRFTDYDVFSLLHYDE
jgi:adenine phosphoribosyltransferase